MRRALTLVLFMLAVATTGCSNPKYYYGLEEWGDGWQLKVEEKDKAFRASWVKGDHRSAKLMNYHEAPNGDFYVVNTLYLEIGKDGKVLTGRLKRATTPEMSQRAYYERYAKWFRVLSGTCLLDTNGNGEVDVKCEGGYEFKGTVVPDETTQYIKPE